MNVDFPGSPGVVHRKPNSGQHGAVLWISLPLCQNPNSGSHGAVLWIFRVIPKESEGDSWGLARNFKTSNGSSKTLATLIRGRLWKVCFLRPNPTSPGFLVIPKGSEVDFQVPTFGNP